ncbi:hypothetical protein H4W33_009439 [Kibdelosporangium phytohabitans]|nr:hypothetical protein [Kibdelosporangium phytohabitans]
MRPRTLFASAFASLLLFAGATSTAVAAPENASGHPAVDFGTHMTINAETVYQCNWTFCNSGLMEGSAWAGCQTTGNGTSARWDLVLDRSSFVAGFLPRSTGLGLPSCPNRGHLRTLGATTVYQCNWTFCNAGSIEGAVRVLCHTTGNGTGTRWDLVLDESSFVVGFVPRSTGAPAENCANL